VAALGQTAHHDAMGRGNRLVGRADIKAAVVGALDEARSGSGQFLLISGEAGIGKSAVLSFLAETAGQSCHVLRGFCMAGSGVPPYWPWIQVLRATGLSADDLGEAGRLLDATGHWAEPDGALAAADARFRVQDAIGRSLTALAADRPVVVALDDLHWADEQSLAVLPFLARASIGFRLLIAGAYRDAEASAVLVGMAEHAQHLPITGLSLAETQAMVAALPGTTPPAELTTQVWRRSDGNPFFVRELTRLVQAQGSGQVPGHLPAGVIETVRRRLARLPSESARLLDWAAVAGREIDIALLVAVGAAADQTAVADLLSHASQAGVVATDDPPRFTHDLFRDAILDGQPPSVSMALNLAIGQALRSRGRPGDAARIAAHLVSAGPEARGDAVDYSIVAAREATARLGHDDACAHYRRALGLIDEHDPRQVDVLLELAAAEDRNGSAEAARADYTRAAATARATDDTARLARAALGLQSLGQRSQASTSDVVDLLREADDALEGDKDRPALHSRVLAALTRALRHGADAWPPRRLVPIAERAVALALASGDDAALATAKLALHDALWQPGSAVVRLPVADEMLDAALRAADRELIAVAHELRATALLELGDPAGRDELLAYITLAEQLGHARGRWAALTRKATYAEIAGRVDDAAALAAEALELGLLIGEPDAEGCHDTLRGSLVALGGEEPPHRLGRADPMWPMFPIFRAWGPAVLGDLKAARAELGDFSVLDLVSWTGLEALAAAAAVFAAIGSEEQRRWTYRQMLPFAGTHVVVGGCASYHAAVDHHLGALAASLGDRAAAEIHFADAIAMHRRLGAASWERVSRRALDDLRASDVLPDNEFRFSDGRWVLRFAGSAGILPDAKGLHDLAMLIGAKGVDVHVRELLGPDAAPTIAGTGADAVLDERAKAEYRARLSTLAGHINEAEELGHTARAGRLADERDALIRELAASTGLGGRDRRLGDETERARKTVGARVRDSLAKIERVHPELAAHLRGSVRMGTTCSYSPAVPTKWRLG
jgi:hypothetical protein